MKIETLIVGFVTAFLTYLGTRKQTAGSLKAKELEMETTTEGLYIEHMSSIVKDYKDQVSSFREELKSVKEDFESFKKEHYVEVEEYKMLVASKDDRIEELESENLDLREKNTVLKAEKAELEIQIKGVN